VLQTTFRKSIFRYTGLPTSTGDFPKYAYEEKRARQHHNLTDICAGKVSGPIRRWKQAWNRRQRDIFLGFKSSTL